MVQQDRTSPQPREIRFEMGTRRVIGSDFIDVANAFNDGVQSPKQDGDETGDGPKNEGQCRRLRNNLRELNGIRRNREMEIHD